MSSCFNLINLQLFTHLHIFIRSLLVKVSHASWESHEYANPIPYSFVNMMVDCVVCR